MTFPAALREVLVELDVDVSSDQFKGLCEHWELLDTWNRHINLTGIREIKAIAQRHYGESIFLHREVPPVGSLVDIGSGAGFPGIPVAVLRPGTSVTLIESKRKKAAFLTEATREWRNVRVANCRLAEWSGTAELAMVRAVAPNTVLRDLGDRVDRVAILGTAKPPDLVFGGWEGLPTPWSAQRTLWISSRLNRR